MRSTYRKTKKQNIQLKNFLELKKFTFYADLNFDSSSMYQKMAMINMGSYGKVFKAKKIIGKKLYACKRIRLIYNWNITNIPLLREISSMAYLVHPNIIFMKETFYNEIRDQVFILMEYSEYDLKTLLCSHINFSQKQLKNILFQLLIGVYTLHKNGLIHRDIKTSNILLNNRGVVKICDFGLARPLESKGISMSPGIVTLWYRAPEILLGSDFYSSSVDVWSIGCVFAELISNKVLFEGNSELEQLGKIMDLLGTPTSSIWKEIQSIDLIRKIRFPARPFNMLKKKFDKKINEQGINLLQRMLTYNPKKRISAEKALGHPFFHSND